MGSLQRTERSSTRAICGVQLIDVERYSDLMLMLGFNEVIDRSVAMANCVRWYGHVLIREESHVLRMALDFEVGAQ